jgi:hypothetical protein
VRRGALLALCAAVLTACGGGGADVDAGPEPQAVPSLEVREEPVWLCRASEPAETCAAGLDAVAVTAEGSAPEPFTPAQDPPVDCFYVYPTVSQAEGTNAPKEAEPAVVATMRAQAARFAEVCRLYAPVYRQVTVSALASGGFFDAAAQQTAYDDVRDAWRAYLNEHNDGRGVVLVGHSQGAMALTRLLSEDVLPEPEVRDLIVSALLVGGGLSVPAGSDTADRAGGLPLCAEPGQTGCVVAYSAFAEPPPQGALFGRAPAGREAVCTDPTRLAGGNGVLEPYFPTDRLEPQGGLARSLPSPDGAAAFVTYPAAATAQCQQEDGAAWLQVDRVDGSLLPESDARLGPAWGLHTVDVTLALGNLVEVVRLQGEAWAAGAG